MTARKTFEEILEGKLTRRLKMEDRTLTRLEKREEKAERMVGELTREGRTVCYVWPQGGKYREGPRADLIDFLVRNNYA